MLLLWYHFTAHLDVYLPGITRGVPVTEDMCDPWAKCIGHKVVANYNSIGKKECSTFRTMCHVS